MKRVKVWADDENPTLRELRQRLAEAEEQGVDPNQPVTAWWCPEYMRNELVFEASEDYRQMTVAELLDRFRIAPALTGDNEKIWAEIQRRLTDR